MHVHLRTYTFSGGPIPILMKVTNCCKPIPSQQLRKVDPSFVNGLKKRMLDDPTAPGIPPLALSCIDVSHKTSFLMHLKDQYRYEVLGGLHTITARQELLEEHPGKCHKMGSLLQPEIMYVDMYVLIYICTYMCMYTDTTHSIFSLTDNGIFSECLAFVYCGLTNEEALRLASRHNVNGHFNHEMTHKDYVSKPRLKLMKD